MNLYEINNAIMDCIDADTGEILDAEALQALQMEKWEKIKNVALWVKNLKADVIALKAEADNLTARRKSTEKKIESLTAWLAAATEGNGVKDIQYTISYRKSDGVVVSDESLIPAEYLIPQPAKVNTAAVRAALHKGIKVAGAALEIRNNISVK